MAIHMAGLRRALERAAIHVAACATIVAPAALCAASDQSLEATQLTIDVKDAPLDEVLAEIERQTGNRLADEREQFGQDQTPLRVTLQASDEEYWSALDRLMDDAKLAPYPASGSETLAIVERPPAVLRRSGRATYVGPFRIEAVGTTAQRGARSPEESGLQVQLEIAWEPRLRPLAVMQLAADVRAKCDDGLETPSLAEDVVFDREISAGHHAVEATLPFQLPARRATALATLNGKFTTLVPTRIAEFEFDELDKAREVSQVDGGVAVTIAQVRQNQGIWEIHMRISVESEVEALQSHRGWIFENVAELRDGASNVIENAGLETTMQTADEAGLAYFYELPEGVDIGDCMWTYRTPAAIEEVAVEYELRDVLLP